MPHVSSAPSPGRGSLKWNAGAHHGCLHLHLLQCVPLISAFHPVERGYRIKTLHLAFLRVLSEHPGRSFLQSLFAEHLRDAQGAGGVWEESGAAVPLAPADVCWLGKAAITVPCAVMEALRELPGPGRLPNAELGYSKGVPRKASRRAVFQRCCHQDTHTHTDTQTLEMKVSQNNTYTLSTL